MTWNRIAAKNILFENFFEGWKVAAAKEEEKTFSCAGVVLCCCFIAGDDDNGNNNDDDGDDDVDDFRNKCLRKLEKHGPRFGGTNCVLAIASLQNIAILEGKHEVFLFSFD